MDGNGNVGRKTENKVNGFISHQLRLSFWSLPIYSHQNLTWRTKIISKKLSECSARMMKVFSIQSTIVIITSLTYECPHFTSVCPLFSGCIPAEEMKFVLSQICSPKVRFFKASIMFFLSQTISGGSGDAGGRGQERGRGNQLLRVPLHDGR